MSEEQLVKLNGRTYDQFRSAECYDLDSFDYDFDYSCVEVKGFTFDGGVIDNIELSGVMVEDQFQYVIVDTHEIKKLFISEPQVIDLHDLKQAVIAILSNTLTLGSQIDEASPEVITRSYLADMIAEEYLRITKPTEE